MSDQAIVDTKTCNASYFDPTWLSWNKYSGNMLRNIEKKILQYCKTSYRGWFVDVGPVVGPSDRIWTISMNTDSNNVPLVLLHGLGAGVALWCMNLDDFAEKRPVYSMDILGFGRSSRPTFSSNADEAEKQLVKSIEEWRREMKLDKFVLLGHSMGGFIAASYAITHPERVKHLILADPWGFPEKTQNDSKREIPFWIKAVAFTLQPLNPFWAIRTAGPFGEWLINKVRPDLSRKFEGFVEDPNIINQYIYQCNAQSASGESAFHAMMYGFGWAKNPMVKRIHNLHKDVPITLLYGSRSWLDNSAGEVIKEKRKDSEIYLQIIPGAGHHVYADKPDIFNRLVNDACILADSAPNIIIPKSISEEKIPDLTESDKDINSTLTPSKA